MPEQYEKIKQTFLRKGVPVQEAKTRAAKIYISRGKGGSRSTRAKRLKD